MSKMNELIFLGGIHGVGKSHLCAKISESCSVYHISASDLIRQHREISINKTVNDIDGNQDILIDEIKKIDTDKKYILLDGHFTLVNSLGEIEPVEARVFKAITPRYLIVLRRDPYLIIEQVMKRDGRHLKYEFVNEFQKQEIGHAKSIGTEIGVNVSVIDIDEEINHLVSGFPNYLRL